MYLYVLFKPRNQTKIPVFSTLMNIKYRYGNEKQWVDFFPLFNVQRDIFLKGVCLVCGKKNHPPSYGVYTFWFWREKHRLYGFISMYTPRGINHDFYPALTLMMGNGANMFVRIPLLGGSINSNHRVNFTLIFIHPDKFISRQVKLMVKFRLFTANY